MSETARANEDALIANIPGSCFPTDNTVTIICTVFLIYFLKSGLMVLSITRLERIASSDGFPSLRIKRDPKIFPLA